MRRCRALLVTVLALALLFAFAASAFATTIPVPDAGYLAGTSKIDLTPYYWNGVGWPPPPVPTISDGTLTVTFGAPEMFAAYAPDGNHANAWGDDGVVEATSPMLGRTATRVPAAGGSPTTTMNFSTPVKTFGFEASSLWQNSGAPSGYTATVAFKRGGATIDTVTKVIPAPSELTPTTFQQHAQFFAATDAGGFDQVVMTLSNGALGKEAGVFVAQYRYELLPPPPPPVSTPASSVWSVALLTALGAALVIGRKRFLAL